jgi:polyisoprenoid-binding protein YceI
MPDTPLPASPDTTPDKEETPMQRFAIPLALTLFAAGAQAAPVTYVIDTGHTAPRFEYNHQGLSFQSHRFDKTTGKIVLDREARTGSVDVSIDATSVNTGFPLFNQHIQAVDFFDTAAHPTITFKSTKVSFDGDKPATVQGDLTIKGVTRPVTLTLTGFTAKTHPMYKKDALGANAVARVKRSDFNMGKHVPYVGDEVAVNIALEAIRE